MKLSDNSVLVIPLVSGVVISNVRPTNADALGILSWSVLTQTCKPVDSKLEGNVGVDFS